jgi:tetratricopeptide (TPR) repeat protein
MDDQLKDKRSKKSLSKLKPMIIGISIIISILIGLQIIFYARLMIPQLMNDGIDYTTEPATLSQDSEVVRLLENSKGLNVKELHKLGDEMYEQKKYKEAYNIYKLAGEKDKNQATLMYTEMANCYGFVLNYEEAVKLAEKSLSMINNSTRAENQYYAYYTAAIMYFYREIHWGVTDPDRTLELLKTAVTIQVDDPKYKEYCETRNWQMYEYLVNMYSFFPENYNPEKAIEYLEHLYQLKPEIYGLKVEIALLYLQMDDIKNAEPLIEEYKNENGIDMNALTMDCLYYIKTGKYKKAKKILNKLKIVSINDEKKVNYYSLSSYYYEAIGEREKEKEYYYKFVDILKPSVFTYDKIQAEERLDISFDDVRKELKKEYEAYNKISLELEE